MGLVQFNDNGYRYFGENDHFLFEANKEHDHLFAYIFKDLSQLPMLLEQYISERMDLDTFELTGRKDDDDEEEEEKKKEDKEKKDKEKNKDVVKFEELLFSIHPYYEHEFRKIVVNAIGDYFNSLLIYLVYGKHSLKYNNNEQWYIERLSILIKPFLQAGDTHAPKFYTKYMEWIGADIYDIKHSFICDVPKARPRGFIQELRTQEAVKKMLYWILDVTAPNIAELTTPQRAWLYGNIFWIQYNLAEMKVTKHLSFIPYLRYRTDYDYGEVSEQATETIKNLFRPLYALNKLNVEQEGIPQEMLREFNCATEYVKNFSVDNIYEQYVVTNLHQLLYLEIQLMIQNDTYIKKCKNCGLYFTVTDRKKTYCDRNFDGKNSCSAIGSKRSFQKKLDTEYPLKIYNRAYKTHYARFKNEKLSWGDFETWCKEAKTNLQKVRGGEMTAIDFEKWLKT